MDAYICDGTLYCEDCAPDAAESYPDGGGESDSPQHCDNCLVPLDNPLTQYGIEYVLVALENETKNPDREKAHENYNGTYYHGSPHKQIVLDWASQLSYYFLTKEEEERLSNALEALEQL